MAQLVLVADNDPAQQRVTEEDVRRLGYRTITADDTTTTLDILNSPRGGDVALIILDLVMPGGMTVLETIRQTHRTLRVIVQTPQGGTDSVMKAAIAGADDFFVKPVSPERLHVSIRNMLKVNALTDEVQRLTRKNDCTLSFEDLVMVRPSMAQVAKTGKRAANSEFPVLIEGGSGVGKEMIARAIHGASDRCRKPFVIIKCGAFPDKVVESIPIGREIGSINGAVDNYSGMLAEAKGGTLFLDEVSELPRDIQAWLLRALQEGQIKPEGSKRPISVDIRLISATSRDLIEMIKEGRFLEGLYYHLSIVPIMVPPLHECRADIPSLVEHFLARFAAEESKHITGVDNAVVTMLQSYDWPGNVRQLENAVFRAIVLCDSCTLSVHDFPQIATIVEGFDDEVPPAPRPETILQPAPIIGGNLPKTAVFCDLPDDKVSALGILALTRYGQIRKLEDVESDMIRLALERYCGHMSEAARKLGIGRTTLYRKLREMRLAGQES